MRAAHHTHMHPDLLELSRRLEANGTIVVPFKDHLEIRLALFATVQVRPIDGRLSCEPRFGFIPRDRATWVTLIGIDAVRLPQRELRREHGGAISVDRVLHHARADGVHADDGDSSECAPVSRSAARARRAGAGHGYAATRGSFSTARKMMRRRTIRLLGDTRARGEIHRQRVRRRLTVIMSGRAL